MKPTVFLCLAVWLLNVRIHAAESNLNSLTPAEREAGWRLLFDGRSLDGWRTYKPGGTPGAGWKIEDGLLKKIANVPAGDLMTEAVFTDFEFAWEWRLGARGNNGVKYFIIPERNAAVGHEYQMIDDAVVKGDALSGCASFYLVVAPAPDKPMKPPGEWNQSRIVVKGNRVEHWLNGAKVVEYDCGAPAILEQVRKTKFKDAKDFGKKVTGHLLLTDHKDECWFRNLKVRELQVGG